MNENARKWVEALRSGEFEQTRATLKDDQGHCCLGVACEVYNRETGEGEWIGSSFTVEGYSSSATLPNPVRQWLGLKEPEGEYVRDEDDDDYRCLTGDNDKGAPFERIADIIEAEPSGLFVA